MSKKQQVQEVISEENASLPKKKRKNGRGKGHNYERDLVLIFKSLGFDKCATSRYASRMLDDCKVDLANIPLNVQAKNGYWNNRPKPEVIFKEMKAHLDSNFPPGNPQRDYPKILFHKLDGFADEHQLATMMIKDWVEIYKNNLAYLKLQNQK